MREENLSYQFEINYGAQPGGYFGFSVVDIPQKDVSEFADIEFIGTFFSVSEDYVDVFLMPFLEKYYDASFLYNSRQEIDESDKESFSYYSEENIYSFDAIEKMCDEILDCADMLENDYTGQEFGKIREAVLKYYKNVISEQKNGEDSDEYKRYLNDVVSFYIRFVKVTREIIAKDPQYHLFSVSGV